jgi:hypothetical protein
MSEKTQREIFTEYVLNNGFEPQFKEPLSMAVKEIEINANSYYSILIMEDINDLDLILLKISKKQRVVPPGGKHETVLDQKKFYIPNWSNIFTFFINKYNFKELVMPEIKKAAAKKVVRTTKGVELPIEKINEDLSQIKLPNNSIIANKESELEKLDGNIEMSEDNKVASLISLEDAKRMVEEHQAKLEAEKQQKIAKAQEVLNEVDAILLKNGNQFKIGALVTKERALEILKVFLDKPETQLVTLQPEIYQNIQSEEAA